MDFQLAFQKKFDFQVEVVEVFVAEVLALL
jgi:hypothetical protein